MISIIETYVHILGMFLTLVLLSGYLMYRYFKKRKK
jgi:hypothetical protein